MGKNHETTIQIGKTSIYSSWIFPVEIAMLDFILEIKPILFSTPFPSSPECLRRKNQAISQLETQATAELGGKGKDGFCSRMEEVKDPGFLG